MPPCATPLPELAHDVLAAGEHGDRVAVGDRLGEGAQVGAHAVELLHAAARDAEAGLDLVDDQHDAVAVAQLAGGAQVGRIGGDAEAVAHDRLDQQAGDRVAVALEDVLELVGIVRLHEMREVAGRQRHALAVGVTTWGSPTCVHFSIGVYHIAASNSP